ncbi:S-adenosylmethionine decarboxylase proenzyme, partial [Bacillus cereus]|nr:S-adenosylmethionine decarboxylase proenzyme [Bacillus cereus]
MEYDTVGQIIIVDLCVVDFSVLDDTHFLEDHVVIAAECSGGHVLNVSIKE